MPAMLIAFLGYWLLTVAAGLVFLNALGTRAPVAAQLLLLAWPVTLPLAALALPVVLARRAAARGPAWTAAR